MRKLIALVVAAASLAAASLAAASPTAAAAQEPTLTLSIAKPGGAPQYKHGVALATVTYGERVRVTGSTSPARPGETVTMQIGELGGSGGVETRTFLTDSQGKFEFVHQPTRRSRTQYEADLEGYSGDYAYAEVRPKILFRLLSARPARFSVKATVDPYHPANGRPWTAFLEVQVSKRPIRWESNSRASAAPPQPHCHVHRSERELAAARNAARASRGWWAERLR